MTNVTLLAKSVLADFPSGSGINYHDEHLYLIGDDATGIIILDKTYTVKERINIFSHSEKRIPKSEKTDFETSTIVTTDTGDYLCIIGSGSKKRRAVVLLMPLHPATKNAFEFTDYVEFRRRLESNGIQELNIEGAAIVNDVFLLANRSNHTNRENYFIATSIDFWKNQASVPFRIIEISIAEMPDPPLGISELCYVKTHDLLLVTLSSENTSSSYDDGTIGDSYIGWIGSISSKINSDRMGLDGIINLSDVDTAFQQQKIEGICVENAVGNDFILHLVSDNDLGESVLFKIRMVIN